MISEKSVEDAVVFFGEKAEEIGKLVGRCKALEHKLKQVKGLAFLKAQGTVAERQAIADSSEGVREIVEEIENAWADRVTLETKLKGKEFGIDVWRSQFSKYGKGIV